MRPRDVIPAALAAAAASAAVAIASHPTVDPATVPTGYLAAHSQLKVALSDFEPILKRRRAAMFFEHKRLAAGEATPFHMHPGPAIVSVVAGSLTVEERSGDRCRRRTVPKGLGHVTGRGTARAHREVAGTGGADYYVITMAPRTTGPETVRVPTPAACA